VNAKGRSVPHWAPLLPFLVNISFFFALSSSERSFTKHLLGFEKTRSSNSILEVQDPRSCWFFLTTSSLFLVRSGPPATVCAHPDCYDAVRFERVCHGPCGLGMELVGEGRGNPPLRRCWAMRDDQGNEGACRVCGHSYMEHVHKYYGYTFSAHRQLHPSLSSDFISRATAEDLKRQARHVQQEAIEQFRFEKSRILDAAASLSLLSGLWNTISREWHTPFPPSKYCDHFLETLGDFRGRARNPCRSRDLRKTGGRVSRRRRCDTSATAGRCAPRSGGGPNGHCRALLSTTLWQGSKECSEGHRHGPRCALGGMMAFGC